MSSWDRLGTFLEAALVIVFVGYMESIAIAQTLGSRRRQKVDANQELIAFGIANVGASFTGGYPVTGGFSRSVVNFEAGATTPLASVGTAALVALTVTFLTPMLYYVPHAVLSAVIVVAVASFVEWRMPFRLWRSNKADAFALVVTFVARICDGNRARSSGRHGHVTGSVSLADQPASHRRRWSSRQQRKFPPCATA